MKLFDIQDRATPPPPAAVRVNGREIPREAIAREIQNHPAETPLAAREAAVSALVVRELLLQEAQRRQLEAAPRDLGDGRYETVEDALVRALLDDALDLPEPTEAECRRFYENNRQSFESPAIYAASHILLSVDTSDETARAEAWANASDIAMLACEEPDTFAELARTFSDCPSASQGGNLGQVTRGQTTPAFEAALDALQPGATTSEPIETPYGFHVIRLDRRIPGEVLPFDAVSGKVAAYLADAVFHRAVHQFVRLLAGAADIEGADIEGAVSQLVQ